MKQDSKQLDGEVVELNLPIKEDVKPVAQKPRRFPYHRMEPVKKRINEFVEVENMEKVPECEPISWCSPIVVQPKPNNPNNILVSLDLRVLNKSTECTQQGSGSYHRRFYHHLQGLYSI